MHWWPPLILSPACLHIYILTTCIVYIYSMAAPMLYHPTQKSVSESALTRERNHLQKCSMSNKTGFFKKNVKIELTNMWDTGVYLYCKTGSVLPSIGAEGHADPSVEVPPPGARLPVTAIQISACAAHVCECIINTFKKEFSVFYDILHYCGYFIFSCFCFTLQGCHYLYHWWSPSSAWFILHF